MRFAVTGLRADVTPVVSPHEQEDVILRQQADKCRVVGVELIAEEPKPTDLPKE